MRKFRVATNGESYQVQVKTGWFGRWEEVWTPAPDDVAGLRAWPTFSKLELAENFKRECEEKERLRNLPWRAI